MSQFSFLGIKFKTKTRKSQKIHIFRSIDFECVWISFGSEIRKWTRLHNSRGFGGSYKTTNNLLLCVILNSISNDFKVTLSYVNVLVFYGISVIFKIFVYLYKAENENPNFTDSLYFRVFKVSSFDQNLNFSSLKTEININRPNLINLVRAEAHKRNFQVHD